MELRTFGYKQIEKPASSVIELLKHGMAAHPFPVF
jgi:hypothetical protein